MPAILWGPGVLQTPHFLVVGALGGVQTCMEPHFLLPCCYACGL